MKNCLLNKIKKLTLSPHKCFSNLCGNLGLFIGLLILTFISQPLQAQKEDFNWIFGAYDTGRNHFQWDDDLNLTIDTVATTASFYLTNSAISDEDGVLSLYTNGRAIYNGQTHQIVENGDSINYGWYWEYSKPSNNFSAQNSTLFINSLNNENESLLFHLNADTVVNDNVNLLANVGGRNLLLTTVTNSNNQIRVLSKNQIIIEDTLVVGSLAACRHANGRDWWITSQEANNNCLNVLLYTPDTLYLHHKECVSFSYDYYNISTAKFSPDGSKFIYAEGLKGIKIFDFDRCSGQLTFREHLPRALLLSPSDPIIYYVGGFAISPNSRYLYTGPSDSTFRFDLQSSPILSSQILIAWAHPDSANIYGFDPSSIQADGRIYAPAGNFKNYSVMNNPDDCNSVTDCDIDYFLPLPKNGSHNFGNFPNYRLGRLIGSPCDTLPQDTIIDTTGIAINELPLQRILNCYPNPAKDKIRIEYAGTFWESVNGLSLKITNVLGQEYYNQKLPEYSARQTIDLTAFPKGVYLVSLIDDNNVLARIRFVRE